MTKEEIRKIAKELYDNILWDNMEFIVYNDGEIGTRQEGAFGEYEDEIIYKIRLSKWYWCDTLIDWGINPDYDEDVKIENANAFIDALADEIEAAFEEAGIEIE